ncbi:dihydroorotate dehydrogenase [Colletotrichum paranaense]|uniref:Dihydroorotate dehydrogenase n=1 Tax=Colletotrichum paranaense TaxID=1914294 RepID=A0ABQ9SVL7_9PEZI|nr:dihydroorotate dehydrogenase [Colletotrichum paranaense]KAK1543558.1 dihydroorotate dehydrogenase [Colletotrichum paranaense]
MATTTTLFRVFLRRQTLGAQGLRNRLAQQQQRRANSSSEVPKPKRAEDPIPVPNTITTIPLWQRLGPLTRAGEGYARAQRKRPLTTQFISSLVIYFCADLSAQNMSGNDYNPERTMRSLIIGAISSIPSYKWFIFLSQNFNYASRLLSLATKVVVNQVCFTPIFNSYFFGMQAFLAGDNFDQIIDRIRQCVPVSIVNSCKLWPAVTAFSFSFIPMEYRSVFSGVIAVGWQTYLSFLNRQAEVVEEAEEVQERSHAVPAIAAHENHNPQNLPNAEPLSAGQDRQLFSAMASICLRSCRVQSALRSARNPTTVRPRLPSNIPRRHASTGTGSSTESQAGSGLKTGLYSIALVGSLYVSYLYVTDTRASIHALSPMLMRFAWSDAEDAHHAGTGMMKTLYDLGLHIRERDRTLVEHPALATEVYGMKLSNPIGISAGLDKHADIPDALFALGAGIVEVGGCTPRPQDGNPRPRVFRVPSLDGMINRYGLNSRGADSMAITLRERVRKFARKVGATEQEVLDGEAGVPAGSLLPGRLLAVQIAKNKETDQKDVNAVAQDYVYCVQRLARYADILVVNVSSPNTPGLRDLQATEPLTRLLGAVVQEARKVDRKVAPKVMVKVSPDEEEDAQIEGIVQAVCSSGVDGVIVGNTTNRRTGIVPQGVKLTVKEQKALQETGGYSGPAMYSRTLDLVGRYRKKLDAQTLQTGSAEEAAAIPDVDGSLSGKLHDLIEGKDTPRKVIFATGGITNGEQALKILNAGASVAMVYTGLTYGGPGTITKIKREIKDQA